MPLISRAPVLHPPSLLTGEDAHDIAVEAWLYAYPLVMMELTRRKMTNVAAPLPDYRAPVNRFSHRAAFPDASSTEPLWPDDDTLASHLWFDVAREPLFLHIPDSQGRYYVLQMLDMWNDVFATFGARTTGTADQLIVLAPPEGWLGHLPRGARLVRSPTAHGLILCRTQTNGVADYARVHQFQLAFRAGPLSTLNRVRAVARAPIDPGWNTSKAPADEIAAMDVRGYFTLFGELCKLNPPHANDYPVLDRLERLGIRPGRSFAASLLPGSAGLKALEEAAPAARQRMLEREAEPVQLVDGWSAGRGPLGSYGTDYLDRAIAVRIEPGSSRREDRVCLRTNIDQDGKPFDSAKRYRLRFESRRLPPVHAFWSLALHDDRALFAHNPINRYALGDRDRLAFGDDGSLDLFVQRESPGADNESNWLPSPAQGSFSLSLNLAWPKQEILDGAWHPPSVVRID
jgi:hypothetical protein